MENEVVYIKRDGPIGTIVLNQPHKKNAISAVMMDLLSQSLHTLENEDEIKVIALRGAEDNFCAVCYPSDNSARDMINLGAGSRYSLKASAVLETFAGVDTHNGEGQFRLQFVENRFA